MKLSVTFYQPEKQNKYKLIITFLKEKKKIQTKLNELLWEPKHCLL